MKKSFLSKNSIKNFGNYRKKYYLCICKNICKDFVIFASKITCFSSKQVRKLVLRNKLKTI